MNQIEEREEEDPDHVNDMPVEAAQVDWRVITSIESAPHGQDDQPGNDEAAHDHVDTMKPGHHEVDREELLRIDRSLWILKGMSQMKQMMQKRHW